tara:strand:- start:1121 stop:1432 length:312 start_codon:yes stop_codon:yes gene_type:complete
MMKGKRENGHRTKVEIEIYSDKDGDYFIEVLNQTHPWVIGAFYTLDEALRYTYFELDNPIGSIEVIDVSKGDITFSFEFEAPPSTKSKLKNVIPLRSKNGKNK